MSDSHTETRPMIDLSANENPHGPSPLAIEAMRAELDSLHRYPSRDGDQLRDLLASQLELQRDHLLLGNGATELLEFAARASLSETTQAQALIATPCFVPYPKVIRRAGGQLIELPCALGQSPLPQLLEAVGEQTRLIILGNPNNPTGSLIRHDELQAFLAELPASVLLVLDEAYIEYVDEPDVADSLALLDQYPNLLVLRSLSKAYGLAGLRIGYAIGHPHLIERLNQQRQHYNTNALAQAAAVAALQDYGHLLKTLNTNQIGLDYLYRSLEMLGLEYLPSHANFVLVRVGNGQHFVESLQRHGILVKPMQRYALPDYIRVSVGLPQQNWALIQALHQLLNPGFGQSEPSEHAQRLSA